MTLQRRIGNNRISHLAGASQTNPSAGAVDDPHEGEADRLAEAMPQQAEKKRESPVAQQFVMEHSLSSAASAQRQSTNAAAGNGQSANSIIPATAANAAPLREENQTGPQPPVEANGDATRTGDVASPNGKGEGQPDTGAASEGDSVAHSKSPTEKRPSSQTREAKEANKRSVGGALIGEQAQTVAEAESVAAEIEKAPAPSLASLIEPRPEEASQPAERAGSALPANSSAISPASTTQIARAELNPSRVIARSPDQEGENDNEIDADNEASESGPGNEATNDPIAGRAAVQGLAGMLTSASVDSQTRIQQQAETTKATLTENAETLRQQVYTQIDAAVASLRVAFATERATLQASISETRGEVAAALETRRAAALSQGEEAKRRLQGLFTQQRSNIAQTVEASVSVVDEIQNSGVSQASQRTRQQATKARHDGDRKNASYPATERGEAQGEAALAVAQETAEEIESRLPETIEAIGEIVEDIPDEFREKGEEALEGIDEGLPDLLARVDEQVQAVVDALDNQATQANEQLDLLENQVRAQLESAENASIAQAEALGPQADAQIDAGLETAFGQLDASVPQAGEQIQQIVDQAVEILNEIESPNVKGANEMVQQLLRFVTGATGETIAAQEEASVKIVEEFRRIDQATSEGLMDVEQDTANQLPALSASVKSSLSNLVVQLNEGFGQTLTGMDEAFLETEEQIRVQLDQSVEQLAIDFGQTMEEAAAEVMTAVDEGLANNDEALAELGPQMNEAADDAGWDYDHPILSGIRDFGAIVLGVIAGILVVLALVVVAIVAFKVLIAGLIVLGVSAAIAKVIAVVIGLGLLAYGIYTAYQARIAKGEAGGWGTFGGALLDVTGITDIGRAFTEEGLSPFERGFAFGRGIATVATFFLGRRLNQRINSRLPRSITNPTRGSALRWLRGRFAPRPQPPGRAPLQLPAPRQRGRQNTVPEQGPIQLNPKIEITEKGLQHVTERHTVPGLPKWAGKSKFNVGEDVARLIQEGTQQPMVRQGNGNFARTFDTGRIIGVDRTTGQPTSIMTIITRANNELVTAFPGRP